MNTISKSLIKMLGDYDFEISVDYSGREMYGKKCFSITFDNSSWENLREELTEVHEELLDRKSYSKHFKEPTDTLDKNIETLEHLLDNDNVKIDNMGMGYVFYYPNLELEDDMI